MCITNIPLDWSCDTCANFDTPVCPYCEDGSRYDPNEEQEDCPGGACPIKE